MAHTDNLSATLYGPGDLRMESSPCPNPGNKELLLSMRSCGICGTDLHMFRSWDMLNSTEPFILGHESSAVVEAVGRDVTKFKIGDRVAVELDVPCRRCELCKIGRYNLCKGFSKGSLTRLRTYAEDFCHRLPDSVSFDEGALLEPLAVAVRACRRGGVALGSSVLICGAGPIGLATALAAKALGAASVCVTDLSERRLQLAREMGADHIVVVGADEADDAVLLSNRVIEVVGDEVDVALECSGHARCLAVCLKSTIRGGCVVPVGLYDDVVAVPLQNSTVRREVDVRGTFSYAANDYPAAISIMKTTTVDLTQMITHHFPLTQLPEVLKKMQEDPDQFIKVIINCQE